MEADQRISGGSDQLRCVSLSADAIRQPQVHRQPHATITSARLPLPTSCFSAVPPAGIANIEHAY